MQSIYHLTGSIKHYDWGGFSFLPSLTGSHNYHHEPFAEYWLGVHTEETSKISFETESRFLSDFIRENRSAVMGKTAVKFDNLPFLFKILDVREMLSIQVHPDKSQATEGFKKENEKGIALNDPSRNYKDANHKSEMMVALSDFYLLHGFKPEQKLLKTLTDVPELENFLSAYRDGGYKSIYETSLRLPEVDDLLIKLAARILPLYEAGKLKKDDADFWAAKAMKNFASQGHYDRGIFSIYFFNLLHLKKGEGVFQDAGLPHAYLEGQNVEVMTSSDNVLRAGLTHKHVDVEELLTLVKFQPTVPAVIRPAKGVETIYHAPVKEFELIRFCIDREEPARKNLEGPAIVLSMTEALLKTNETEFWLHPGNAVLVLAENEIEIHGKGAELYLVTIPEDKN